MITLPELCNCGCPHSAHSWGNPIRVCSGISIGGPSLYVPSEAEARGEQVLSHIDNPEKNNENMHRYLAGEDYDKIKQLEKEVVEFENERWVSLETAKNFARSQLIPNRMTDCYTEVVCEISIHQLINGLEALVEKYPADRLSMDQANRLSAVVTRIVRKVKEYAGQKEKEVSAQTDALRRFGSSSGC